MSNRPLQSAKTCRLMTQQKARQQLLPSPAPHLNLPFQRRRRKKQMETPQRQLLSLMFQNHRLARRGKGGWEYFSSALVLL